MSHWLERLWLVADSKSVDLREMAVMLEVDPSTFYRGQGLSSCDLRGQDLRDMDLTGCNLEKSLIDSATKISPVFDPRQSYFSDYIVLYVTRDMNKLVLDFSEEFGYKYPAWAFKALLERGINCFRRKHWRYYEEVIKSNAYFKNLLDYKSRSSLLSKTLQVHNRQQKIISKDMGFGLDEKRFAWAMFVGLLAIKIPFGDNKDYSVLTPNALVKRRITGAVIPEQGSSS